MSNKTPSKSDIIKALWDRGNLQYKLKGKQVDVYKAFKEANDDINVICCSRRWGKCLKSDTLILTPKGNKCISDLKPGDEVYGYNKDGTISPCKVTDVVNNGPVLMYDLVNNGKVLETSSLDHTWLTSNTYKDRKGNFVTKVSEKKVKDFNSRDKIVRYLANNSTSEIKQDSSVKVTLSNPRMLDGWDISIDNDTHLYLTANGLVTHNSFVLCILAVELCIARKNAVVKMAAPTKTQIKEIATKIMRTILEDCPPHLVPEWKEAEKRYVFPNGSEIQMAATDNGHIENLRGGHADLCIIDEAGFATELNYAVHNVLAPTTDTTDGKVLLASTPNYLDPNHEFNTDYVLPLQEAGTLKKFTIHDAPMITPERIKKIVSRYGVDNPRYRCEYLCEVAVSSEKMVLGEFNPEKEFEIVKEYPRPPHYDAYVSMDIGFVHLTGVLFAYYDYLNSTVVIEDELVVNGQELTTEFLAQKIKEKESEVFRNKIGYVVKPYLRIADNNNPILLNDLFRLHGLAFIATAKDNKDAQINEVKLRIQQTKLIINPRCKNLIYHMKSAKWNKKRTGFELLRDNKEAGLRGGHADFVDALIYLIRNVCTTKSPYPDGYFDLVGSNVFDSRYGENKTSSIKSLMKKLLNMGEN